MDKVYVVYWSQSGNTQAMAEAIGKGASDAGKEASVLFVSDASVNDLAGVKGFALGCPAMGAEVLEETEFDPMFSAIEGSLSGKKVVLFGSYGWGDGQWMRDWEDRCKSDNAQLVTESVIANNAPSADDLDNCSALGRAIA
jgi:flavodoxin short chain